MIKLIDTHQHLINRDKFSYSWAEKIPVLSTGNFDIAAYKKLTSGYKIAGTLFMEAAVDDADYQNETRCVAELMANPDNSILGIISSCRPETDAGFEAWLDECEGLGVVGFRRICHTQADELSQTDTFRSNVRKIGERGKTFDMCFKAEQLPIATELASACDNTTMILDHCGVPDIAGGALDPWRQYITDIAALPNVFCKLSGIMAYCQPGEASLASIDPYVSHILVSFGADRVVWGSDWPVVNLANGLTDWLEVTTKILDRLPDSDSDKICNTNPVEIYKIKQ